MKIIKNGINLKNTQNYNIIYRIICNNCECEFECYDNEVETKNETFEESSIFAFGAGSNIVNVQYKKINCPHCNEICIIDEKIISSEWKPYLN